MGYDRYSSRAALEELNQLYRLLRLYVNFFQPSMKLKQKSRDGAKVHKVYHSAKTPYRRILESTVLSSQQREALDTLYRSLNPVELRAQINQTLDRLWSLAEHRDRKEISVTPFMRQAMPVR